MQMPFGSATVERTADGRRLAVGRRIDAPRATVWDLFVDTCRWLEWGPSVTAVDAPRRIAAGTRGRVRVVGGLWLPFEVTDCREYRWRWRIYGVPATGHRVEAIDEGNSRTPERCRAVFEVPIPAVAYVPVCALALVRLEELAARERRSTEEG